MADKSFGNRTSPNGTNFFRGKSLNSTNPHSKPQTSDYKSKMNRLANGLINFKIQIPRIVAMKK